MTGARPRWMRPFAPMAAMPKRYVALGQAHRDEIVLFLENLVIYTTSEDDEE